MAQHRNTHTCRLCHGNGLIEQRRVLGTGELLWLCDECEAVWLSEASIPTDEYHQFGAFMRARGLSGLWNELGRP